MGAAGKTGQHRARCSVIGGFAKRFVVDKHQRVGANHDRVRAHDGDRLGFECGIEFAERRWRHRCVVHFLGGRGDDFEFDARAAEQFLAAR